MARPAAARPIIARATAGELGAKFMSIGLSDVLDMWIGNSEKNLHEIFETARANRPCVLFFDEIDALGRKRSLMRQNAGRNVVNQLLAEMDSVGADNEGVFILAATNHPWDIDTALRRPGRLDRTLLVLPPDAPPARPSCACTPKTAPWRAWTSPRWPPRPKITPGPTWPISAKSAAELALEDSLATGKVRPISDERLQARPKRRPPQRPSLVRDRPQLCPLRQRGRRLRRAARLPARRADIL